MSFAKVATATVKPSEFLNERTGASITVVHDPLVFSVATRFLRERDVPDYVSLTAVQVDRSGAIELYIVAFDWSTDNRLSQPITLQTTEREIEFHPLTEFPRDLPDDRQLLAAFSHMERAVYKATPELLAEIAASQQLTLQLNALPKPGKDDPDAGRLWEGRKAFKAFVEFIGARQ